jgi:hypothetical protein
MLDLKVAEQALTVEFKNPWKLLADFISQSATTRAPSLTFTQESIWRGFLFKVRTFFDENPAP